MIFPIWYTVELFFFLQLQLAGWHHSSGDQDMADGNEADFTGVLLRASGCCSISTLSLFNEPENQALIQHGFGISYEASMAHMPTSDSSVERQQQGSSQHITPLESWDAVIQQHSGDLPTLNKFVQSLPPEVLTKKDAQNRTICHTLGSLCLSLSSADISHFAEWLSCACLPECMTCQDTAGNTPLHCVIKTPNVNIDIVVESILRVVPNVAECLAIRNEDDLTPLDLAFEKKLWLPARALAEYQIKHGAGCVLLQDSFLRAMREPGGVDFLPHLLELREHYFPDLDLNFIADTGGRTPWWYLANSNDVSVMVRTLQTLKEHSVDLMQLLTDTERQTRLVEEAADKNRLLFAAIQKVVWCHHSSEVDVEDASSCSNETLSRTSSCSFFSSFDEPENQMSISDSSDEEWKQVDSCLKLRKRRLKKKLVQNSTGYSSFNEPEKQVSISHEPGVPDKTSVTLRAQSTSDSIPAVSFHFFISLICYTLMKISWMTHFVGCKGYHRVLPNEPGKQPNEPRQWK